jgi:Uma2 family endonuclease
MAAIASRSTLTTAEELLRMPDDGTRHELVRGELRVSPRPGIRHGRRAVRIGRLLDVHAERTSSGVAVGDAGFLLSRDPDTVRGPDAAFISSERFDAVGDTEKFWPGAPDLAVEVISPNDSFREVQEKALEWVAAGSVAVLVIDPEERTATVYRAGGEAHVYGKGETVDLNDAVPGFTAMVDELFT